MEMWLAFGPDENWLSSRERDWLGMGGKRKRTQVRRIREARASMVGVSSFAPDFIVGIVLSYFFLLCVCGQGGNRQRGMVFSLNWIRLSRDS